MSMLLKTVSLQILMIPLVCMAQQQILSVDNPFLSDTSRMNFSKCFPKVSKDDIDKLKKISQYKYLSFPAATPCTTPGCNPKYNEFTSTRVVTFRASELNPETVRASVDSLVGGDCSYNRVFSFSSTVSRNSISYRYSPYHKERSCNYGVVFDKGTASADVENKVTLREDLSIAVDTFVTNKKTTSNFSFGNAFADALFGSLIAGPTGAFIGAVGLPEIDQMLTGSQMGTAQFDINFADTGIDRYLYSDSKKKLDKLGLIAPVSPYKTVRSASGFVLRARGDVVVEVAQAAQVIDLFRNDFIAYREDEIKFLSELNEVEPSTHQVTKGENLWTIVKNQYRDARLFIFISEFNKLSPTKKLLPGMTLQLPRWHDLCVEFGGNPDAVESGETLWTKAKQGQIPSDLRRVQTYSGRKNLIYPLEILGVTRDTTP